jgi:hypothetical protein
MGPLFMGGGGGVSTLLRSVEDGTWSIAFPEAMSWESVWTRVALEEVWVVLREMVVDVEAELVGVVYGFGEDAKFLKEGSDIRGAFQGNRRMTMQQKIIANDQISAGWGSYRISVHTSGARYGSLPTMPRVSKVLRRCTCCLDEVLFERIFEDNSTTEIDDFDNAEFIDTAIIQFQISMGKPHFM